MFFIPRSALAFHSLLLIPGSCALLLSLGVLAQTPAYGESATRIPAPAVDAPVVAVESFQTAVLAGGCFWGIQAVFQHVKGVTGAVSGYAGGSKATANYDQVRSGGWGRAEV